jgi:hypothetical protein
MVHEAPSYETPHIRDHGSVERWTGSTTLLVGKQVWQLAAVLSVPAGIGGVTQSGGGGGKGNIIGAVQGVTQSGGGNGSGHLVGAVKGATKTGTIPSDVVPGTAHGVRGAATGADSAGGSGGQLPFTGSTVTIAAATLGTGLAMTGTWLRRSARRMVAGPAE